MIRFKFIGFIGLVFILMTSCKTQKILTPVMVNHVADVEVDYLRVNDDELADDATVEAMIAPFRNVLSEEMNEVIATLDSKMYKARPNSSLGNWLTDLLHEEAERLTGKPVDFALQNYGGIRIGSVDKGEIKVMKVFEIMPFDNELVTLTIPGPVVKKLCDKIAESGGWPMSHGLNMGILDGEAVNIMIKGKPFDESQTYHIALPDYVANGGDQCFFLENKPMTKTGLMIREVMIENLKRKTSEGKTIQASNEKRVTIQ